MLRCCAWSTPSLRQVSPQHAEVRCLSHRKQNWWESSKGPVAGPATLVWTAQSRSAAGSCWSQCLLKAPAEGVSEHVM